MISVLRVARVVLSVAVLITLVIGIPVRAQTGAVNDASIVVAHDDGGPDAYVAAPVVTIERAHLRVVVIETAQCADAGSGHLVPVLSRAPKTSPPWNRS